MTLLQKKTITNKFVSREGSWEAKKKKAKNSFIWLIGIFFSHTPIPKSLCVCCELWGGFECEWWWVVSDGFMEELI